MDDIDAIVRAQMAAAEHACRVWMEHVVGEGQRGAPLDEGTLRGAGTVTSERTATGAVITGSFSTVYAARQHEELSWNHPKGGHAKYLEIPFKANVSRLEPLVAAAVAAATP